jgi:hypothetical protein
MESPEYSRTPEEDDLVTLCRELNKRGAKYVIIGGFAIIYHGFLRATEDVDLLIERSKENQKRVIEALKTLPDKAIEELEENDLDEYKVVRIADEIIIDLMLEACGTSYGNEEDMIEYAVINDVTIPFAKPEFLLKLKQTLREKDEIDRIYLQRLINKKSEKN